MVYNNEKPMKIPVHENIVLLDLLREKLGIASNTRIRKLIRFGGVTLGGVPVERPDLVLLPGQVVEVRRSKPVDRQKAAWTVLYEDPHLIAVEKPAGLLSISTETEKADTFYRAVNRYVELRSRGRERIFIVHRLDREASGVMLFAKTEEVKRRLQKNWHHCEKRYSALVEGHPAEKEGTIKSWLREDSFHNVSSCDGGPHAKYAVTHYRQVKAGARYTLLDIRLETGRKHQIRVHLSELGSPVAGDKKYGAKTNPFRRLALHAYSLTFVHPVSRERITVVSPAPKAFEGLEKLRSPISR